MKPLRLWLDQMLGRYTVDDYATWVANQWTGGINGFTHAGHGYPVGAITTWPNAKTESIDGHFQGYTTGGLRNNGIVSTLELIRVQVFSQARFQWRQLRNGRPGDLFGTAELAPLETPFPGGTTGDLLARMVLDADLAGNFYGVRLNRGVLRLRPDWVDIIVDRQTFRGQPLGVQRVGYAYWEDGNRDGDPTILRPEEVAHFAPYPDPLASYRGMSWMTPVLREIMGDIAWTGHKNRFAENAMTPNMVVSLKESVTPDQFDEFVTKMRAAHQGPANAGKTLFLGGGADVMVVGANMQQLDFKVVQGAGETRLAAASGVGAVIAQFSEGMQGSSLNAGNYQASKRRFADVTMRHLWQEASGALATVVDEPPGSHLWYDDRDIPFLQDDRKDAASAQLVEAQTIAALVREGFTPDSVTKAQLAYDWSLLQHTGKLSVQLQDPNAPSSPATEPAAPSNGDRPEEVSV